MEGFGCITLGLIWAEPILHFRMVSDSLQLIAKSIPTGKDRDYTEIIEGYGTAFTRTYKRSRADN